MSTRSAIGYLQPSGSVRAVYCHWDGYPSHQEPILKKHYNTTAKVKALVKPGFMSSLRTRDTWETYGESALVDSNGDYIRDSEGLLRKEGDREPQPLYHHERAHFYQPNDTRPMASDFCQPADTRPKTSGRPLDFWFKERDCEYLYVWDGKKWITYSKYLPEND